MKKLASFIVVIMCFWAVTFAQSPPTAIINPTTPDTAVSQAAPNAAVVQSPPTAIISPAKPDTAASPKLPDTAVSQDTANTAAIQHLPDSTAIPAQPEPEPIPPPPTAPEPVQQAATPEQPAPEPAAQSLPRIAVYVTGNVGEEEKKSLGTRMLASLVNSKRYRGIERTNSFLAEIEKEQVKQRSGDIDDSQISALGKQFGVKFICVADITPALGAFHVSARIINVETAEVEFIGDASSPLKTLSDLAIVSDIVVKKMFDEPEAVVVVVPDFTAGERWTTWALNIVPGLGSGIVMKDTKGLITNAVLGGLGWTLVFLGAADYNSGMLIAGAMTLGVSSAWNIYRSAAYHRPNSTRAPRKNWISYGVGGFFASDFGGGVEWENYGGGGEEVAMPYYGGGGYFYIDLIYAELFAGYSGGGGKWESNDASNPDDLPDMRRTYINGGLFLKWPFGDGKIRVFPLAGIDFEHSISAKFEGNSRMKKPNNTDLGAPWFKFGVGADVNLTQRAYVRAEALYGLRMSPNNYEENLNIEKVTSYQGYTQTYYANPRDGNGVTLKTGVGLKF